MSEPGRSEVNPGESCVASAISWEFRLVGDCGCGPADVITSGGTVTRSVMENSG
jgi:hypothetical protein